MMGVFTSIMIEMQKQKYDGDFTFIMIEMRNDKYDGDFDLYNDRVDRTDI